MSKGDHSFPDIEMRLDKLEKENKRLSDEVRKLQKRVTALEANQPFSHGMLQ